MDVYFYKGFLSLFISRLYCLVVFASVFAGSLAVAALATHHVITTSVFTARLAVTASTHHVVTTGVFAARLAVTASTRHVIAAGSAAGSTAGSAAGSAAGSTAGLARCTAALASTTHRGGHVCVKSRDVGWGVHLYIKCEEINTAAPRRKLTGNKPTLYNSTKYIE
jgi:hypothetical protein